MRYNFKNRPVKASPQAYETWIKGLEKELRTYLTKDKSPDVIDIMIKEILGE